ncbi:MAG: sortase [Actinobacteria bacterium]|nr:sortase [Actinomycetota bacterium]
MGGENGEIKDAGGAGGGEEESTPRSGKRRRKGKILIIVGISLILAGLLALVGIYGYIYYTDRKAAAAQEELFEQWERDPASPERENVSVGDGIARIIAPSIGLDAIVVELWGLDDAANLKRGPGHIPDTAYPGQPGNCVISGHRTTYGAPFRHIEQLVAGDEITLVTADNRYTYEVYEQRIVLPTDLTVLEQAGEPKLTLTACHPWYSAAQRIVVIARLVESEPL